MDKDILEMKLHIEKFKSLKRLRDMYFEILDEAKRTSVGKFTRQAKIKRATGALAHGVAKKRNDPMYKKMVFHRDKYRALRDKITKKYSSRVRSRARR